MKIKVVRYVCGAIDAGLLTDEIGGASWVHLPRQIVGFSVAKE
jgi:hypothetical protein